MPRNRGRAGFRAQRGARHAQSSRRPQKSAVRNRTSELDFPEDEQDRLSSEPEPPIENDFTDEDVEDSTSEHESEPETPGLSYNALLEGFGHREERTGSKRKRRKLNGHQEFSDDVPSRSAEVARGSSYTTLLKGFTGPDGASAPLTKGQNGTRDSGISAREDKLSHNSARNEGEEDNASEVAESDDVPSDRDEKDEEDTENDIDVSSGEEDTADPFEEHFNPGEDHVNEQSVHAKYTATWSTARSPLGAIGNCMVSRPANGPTTMQKQPPRSTSDIAFLKSKLLRSSKASFDALDDVHQALATPLFEYEDVLFGGRSITNTASLRQIACLHALNHIFKTRDRVLKNNTRVAANTDVEARDQGFTRPKVLFLLETRQNCYRYAETIIELCGAEQVENKKRLTDAFSASTQHPEDMPADFRELFDGNDDNVFRVGMKCTRKTLKFFSQFYASDVIFASPLGLRLAIEGKGSKHQDADFLSSIELIVVDQADAMLMQNWEHVEYVFEHLNLQPKESHGCDYSRVRHWYLDGKARDFRQTVIFSAFTTPVLLGLSTKHCHNRRGKLRYQPPTSGVVTNLATQLLGIRQSFSRFRSISPSDDPDARFQYFSTAVLPSLVRLPKPADGGQGILIFVPTHADFTRLQNYFATANEAMNISFGAISEFTPTSDVRRARSHFERGRHSILLYSGRAHHFRRYRIRGAKRVVFYALPDNQIFYEEIVGGFLGQSAADGKLSMNETAVRVMFSKWDLLALERVVGNRRAATMVKDGSGGDTFDFV